MTENSELHWFVNTQLLNFHFTLLQKCPLTFVDKPSTLYKTKKLTCPCNAFFPPLLMDHLEARRRAKVHCREERGEKNHSIPQNTRPAPRDHRGTSRDAKHRQLLGSPPLASSPPVPRPLCKCEQGFRRPGGGEPGGRRQPMAGGADTSQWDVSRCREWEQKKEKPKQKKKKKEKIKGSRLHAHRSIISVMHLSLIKSHRWIHWAALAGGDLCPSRVCWLAQLLVNHLLVRLSGAWKVICQRLLGRDKEEKQNQKSKEKKKKRHFQKAKPFECSASNLSTVYLAGTWGGGDTLLIHPIPPTHLYVVSKFPATFVILLF